MNLSKQIIHLRKEYNLSQEDLAEKVFVSRQSISNWERGKSYPDIESLLLLSNIFDVRSFSKRRCKHDEKRNG